MVSTPREDWCGFLQLCSIACVIPCPLFRYFLAAKPSIERHVFSVAIPTSTSAKLVEPKALTDTAKPGYYSARFSPEAGFYVLNYFGPGIPWTRVIDVYSCKAHILEPLKSHVATLTKILFFVSQHLTSFLRGMRCWVILQEPSNPPRSFIRPS